MASAQFDAGSIMASLDVDRDPFQVGMDLATQQAEEFEQNTISATVTVEADEAEEKLIDLQARLDVMADSSPDIGVDVDDALAMAKLDDLELKVDDLDGREINIKTDTSVSNVDKLTDSLEKAGGDSSGGGAMGFLLKAAIALSPALIPVAGEAAGIGAALAGGFTQGAVALGAFAVVAKSDFTDMTTAAKNLATAQAAVADATTTQAKAAALAQLAQAEQALVGPMGDAVTAYNNFEDVWKRIKQDTATPVFGVITQGLNLAASLLPKIEPLITSTASALSGAVSQLGAALSGPGLSNFLAMISGDIGPDLKDITGDLLNFGGGFGKLVEAVNPLTQTLLGSVSGLSQKFNDWSTSLANGAIQPFLTYLAQNGPLVAKVLGDIGGFLVDLVKDLSPLAGPFLTLIGTLATSLGSLDLQPLAQALGQLALALVPILPALASLINDLLPALIPLIEIITPIIKEFSDGLLVLTTGTMGKVTAGILLFAAAWYILDAAIEADPIVLAVTAIVLAVVGLIALVGEIVDHWSEISAFFEHLWNDVYGFFKKYGAYILDIVAPFIGIPLTIVKNWGSISSFFEGLWNDVSGFFEKNYMLMLQIITDILLWPVAVVKHWDSIAGFFSDMWNDVTKIFSDGWNAVKSGAETAWNDFYAWIKQIPDWVKQVFIDAVTWLLGVGMDIINGLWQGQKDAWNIGISFLTNLPSAVLGFFNDAPTWLYDVGKDVINGLWNGIKDAWNDMTSWISTAAGGVVKVLQKIWDIASPSRVMYQIGSYFTQGLHTGITDGFEPIINDVTKFSRQVTVTLDNGLNAKGLGATAGATVAGQAAAQTQLAATVGTLSDVVSQIAGLRTDVADLPAATGKAVGDTVADKFTTAAKANAKTTATVARQNS